MSAKMRLGSVLADYRYAQRIGVRALATEIGVSAATLNRIENGEDCQGFVLSKILFWLLSPGDARRTRETELAAALEDARRAMATVRRDLEQRASFGDGTIALGNSAWLALICGIDRAAAALAKGPTPMTWFDLRGDERITQRCATEGCGQQPIYRLEAEGVGSNYCSACRAKIEATQAPPEPAPALPPTGLLARLTPTQRAKVLAYEGSDHLDDAGAAMADIRNHMRLFLCWLAYRFWKRWPMDWWPAMAILPYVGEYAYSESRAGFFANAERLRRKE